MEIPPYESEKWKDIVVVYWIHGGGFCTGSSKTMVQAHVEVIQKFNSKSKKLKLVYFAVEYPLAPEVQLADIQDKCFKEFKWLIQTVEPANVVIGGDSAGGNLALCLLRDLSLSNIQIPKLCATFLISPLVDLSLSSCSETELIKLSMSTDFLNVEMLKVWINCALYQSLEPVGVLNKDPKYSPLFANHIDLPNPLIVYSDGEVLAHGIDKWIQKFKKNSSITVLNEPGMPHDYVLFGSAMSQSSSIGFKSNFGLDLISNHILKSVATS
jgi:acetyl esterase/lipase